MQLFSRKGAKITQRRKADSFTFLRVCVNFVTLLEIGLQLRGVTEDQTIKVGVVAQWVEIMIVLGTDTKVRLQIERFLK